MWYRYKKCGGFLLAEVLASSAVLGILLVGLAVTLSGSVKANRGLLVKQRCIAAAEAELDSLTVTGRPVAKEDLNRLWPKLELCIKMSDGMGQWEGMKLVEVTAASKSFRKKVEVTLSRYILGELILYRDPNESGLSEEER